MDAKILVVDDQPQARQLVASELTEAGFEVVEADDGANGWRAFRRERPELVVTDLRMPRSDGIALLERIRSVSKTPVIILTAYGDIPTAVTAMKGGAQEFLTFPEDLERVIEKARSLLAPRSQATGSMSLEAWLPGESAAMRRLRDRVEALATLSVPLLILGERGSGRDTVARAIHDASRFSSAPLVAIRTGVNGSSQVSERPSAIYLDDVTELNESDQAFWSRAVRSYVDGESNDIVRVIASSTEGLATCVEEGRFLAELADQLSHFTVHVPPLRDRIEDIPSISSRVLSDIGARIGRPDPSFDSSAIQALESHRWPGNLSELVSVLERAVAFSPSGTISGEVVGDVLADAPNSIESLRSERNHREKERLTAVLADAGGNLAEAARRLGLSRGAVIYRVQKHGLVPKGR